MIRWHLRCTHWLTMKASLASCLAMQLALGVGYMAGADSVPGPHQAAAVEMLVGHAHGQDQSPRIKQDIELAGFLLTAEEWQLLDPDARAQLLAVASSC